MAELNGSGRCPALCSAAVTTPPNELSKPHDGRSGPQGQVDAHHTGRAPSLARLLSLAHLRHRQAQNAITVLGIAACAVLTGARSYRTIAEWAHDLTPTLRRRLRITGLPPCEATIRRVLQRLDAEQFDLLICRWLARRAGPWPSR